MLEKQKTVTLPQTVAATEKPATGLFNATMEIHQNFKLTVPAEQSKIKKQPEAENVKLNWEFNLSPEKAEIIKEITPSKPTAAEEITSVGAGNIQSSIEERAALLAAIQHKKEEASFAGKEEPSQRWW